MKSRKYVPYLLISPFIISFLVLFVYPAGYSLVLSFFNYRGYGVARFVGIDNFKSLLNYNTFWKELRNTFFYFLMHIVPSIGLGFVFALILRSKYMKDVNKIFKPIIFLPQVIPVSAIALVFRLMLQKKTGVINQMLGLSIPWLDNPDIFRWCVVFMDCWRGVGWFMVIFLAGLTTISPDLYEAATIDGASGVKQVFKITIPLMKPTFIFALLMDAITSFKVYTSVNILYSGAKEASTDVAPIMNQITSNISGGQFGKAAAAGWILFAIIFVITMVEKRLVAGRDK